MNNSVFGTELPQVTELKARLAKAEAERDLERAALAGAMATAKSLAEDRAKAVARSNFFEAEAMNVHLKRAMLVVQRDAAQAGEARAVEALRSVRGACDDVLTYCGPQQQEDIKAIMDCVDGAIYAHELGNGASWLAQQRREAAARALEAFADDAVCSEKLITCNIFDLRSALRTRAAALRAGEVGND